MSSGTQVDPDWAGTDASQGGAAIPPANAPGTGSGGGTYLTDEEILEIDPISVNPPRHDAVIPSARTEDSRRGEARNLSSISTQ